MEMVSTMVYQLTQGASIEEIKAAGLQSYYTEHGCSLFPVDSNGVPFTELYEEYVKKYYQPDIKQNC